MGLPRLRFRPPGVKPWTRIGPLGPFRGRLGLAWVVAPLVTGGVLLGAAWMALRPSPPGGSFRAVGAASSFADESARPVGLAGVWVGRSGGILFAVRAEAGCSLEFCSGRFVDCRGASYGIDGDAREGPGGLDVLPVLVYRETVYVDPSRPLERDPGPPPPDAPQSACP